MKTAVIRSSDFSTNINERFDASFHLSEGIAVKRLIHKSPYPLTTVGKGSKDIFYGNRAKRTYVSDKKYGIPFLSSSDILKADVESVKLASKKYTPCIEQLRLQEGWILVSRSGTIGNTAWTNKQHAQKLASEDVIRIIPNDILRGGYIYAYLSTKYGHSLLTQGTFGAVIQHIEPDHIASIPIPCLPDTFQTQIDGLIKESSQLRELCAQMKAKATNYFEEKSGLGQIQEYEYESYGPRSQDKQVSCFSKNIADVGPVTINAFNHSQRIALLKNRISQTAKTVKLKDCLTETGLFSTGSFPRVELESSRGIELINQRDIFDSMIKGKMISKRGVRLDKLVEKDEIIIAGVGTLGESETFCHCVYGNDYLKGKLISGEFIRMKSNSSIPAGYLFMWLSSDYGFRLIRNTQAGTKLCRPIPQLLENIPVPILDNKDMSIIDTYIKESQDYFAKASFKEQEAINMIEAEIEKWTKQ